MARTEESLDDLLDSALDDLSRDLAGSSIARQGDSSGRDPVGLGKGLPSLRPSKKKSKAKAVPDDPVAATLEKLKDTVKNNSKARAVPDDPLAATLEKLAEKTKRTIDSIEQPDPIESLFGGTEDLESFMGSFMKQILSKEILYEPMKEIGARYPSWLEENKSKLSKEDLERFSKQHKLILELCRTYETSPQDMDKIMELMQSMQGCGQPPAEIVEELAPGLQFGEDGMPQLPSFLPGEEGENPNCSIM